MNPADNQKVMVMCATDRMGFGDDVLGKNFMPSNNKSNARRIFAAHITNREGDMG